MGVVVTLLDQGGDIEQAPVEAVRGQVGQHPVREDVEVVADGLGVNAAASALRRLRRGGMREVMERFPSAPDLRREQRTVAPKRLSHMRQNRQHRINMWEL